MLTNEIIEKIVNYVKTEPRSVQDVAKLIERSWVTTNSYLEKIENFTGRIKIKTFRKGSQGALKVVYFNTSSALESNDAKELLFEHIKNGRTKNDFDFLDVYQFVKEDEKRSILEHYNNEAYSTKQNLFKLLRTAEERIICFSGNLSFLNIKEKHKSIISVIEELLQKKVSFKIISRVNISTTKNLGKLKVLQEKYPGLIEIKHNTIPLRGFIIDNKIARFKTEEVQTNYKEGELDTNTRIFYEITSQEWISWLEKVFWNVFRHSIDSETRLKEIKKLF